jgi:hypothetical protein
MRDVGQSTEDLLSLREPHPAEPATTKPHIADRERLNRRYGLICLISGLATIVLTVIVVTLCREGLTHNRPPFVTMTVIMAILGAGFVGLNAGLLEVLTRYNRTMSRQVLAGQVQVTSILSGQAKAIDDLRTRVAGLKDDHARIDDVISKLPDYGAGVIDGMQIRQSAQQGRD